MLRVEGHSVISMYLDVEKFYDFVAWRYLLLEGTRLGYPMVSLQLAIQAYAMPRVLRIGAHYTEATEIHNSIAAGCA